jgi:hypothetical protein
MRSTASITFAIALMAVGLLAGSAAAASADGWVAGPGTTADGGVVTLVNSGGSGTSYEHPDLDVEVEDGDTVSFQWRSPDGSVTCGGGVPRVFIRGGSYNTFDQDPAGPGACGTLGEDGWYTVTGTISGITDGRAGHTGIVNDNPADPGTIEVRNLVIAGERIALSDGEPTSKEGCKSGGWRNGPYRNQGECVSAFARG